MAAQGAAVVECPFRDEHPKIETKLDEHERRISDLEKSSREDAKELWKALGRVEKTLENMKGWLAGATIAAGVLGAVVTFMAMRLFPVVPK